MRAILYEMRLQYVLKIIHALQQGPQVPRAYSHPNHFFFFCMGFKQEGVLYTMLLASA